MLRQQRLKYRDMNMFSSAAASDYPAIRSVWARSVKATHDFLPEDYFQQIWELFFSFLPSVDLYIHRNEKGCIDGFLGVADGKMEMLFIDPASMGKGLGRDMTLFAIEQLNVTMVDVNEQNKNAAAFYQKMGFRVVSRSATDGMGQPFPVLSMQLSKQ